MSKTDYPNNKTLIWDSPTRVFHWLLVIAFTSAWISSESDRFLFHHVFAGYVFIGLLMFRLIWGVAGSKHARFRSFAYDWPSVTAYLTALMKGQASRHIGHNPAGSYAIFAILILGFLVTFSGLLVLGGEEGHGPLKNIVSYGAGTLSKEIHEIIAIVMLLLVAGHVTGVIVESIYHKENLVWSMISGRKTAPKEEGVKLYALLAVVMLGVISASGIFYFYDYVTRSKERPVLAFVSDPLPDNETWRSECSDCHIAYHPVLLPARSWQKIMTEQDQHFEEDLMLEQETIAEITQFLVKNASESGLTEAAHKSNQEIPVDQTPTRITESAYWKRHHDDIDDRYWKLESVANKINCDACHYDAEQGWFEDSNMELPSLTPSP